MRFLFSLMSLFLILPSPSAEAKDFSFKICSVGSGAFGYRCVFSEAKAGTQTAFVNLVDDGGRAIASFHRLAVEKLSSNLDANFHYTCLYKKYAPRQDDTQTLLGGALCPDHDGSAYIKRFAVKLVGKDARKLFIRYRCRNSGFHIFQQTPDPANGGWYGQNSSGCGPTADDRWISGIEISVYAAPPPPVANRRKKK